PGESDPDVAQPYLSCAMSKRRIAQPARFEASRSRATTDWTAAVRVFKLAWFAMSLAVELPSVAAMRSPFSRRVRPVAVRSTIPSTRPTWGASSTDPCRRTTSTAWPWLSNHAAVVRGYLVAPRSSGGHAGGPSAPDAL